MKERYLRGLKPRGDSVRLAADPLLTPGTRLVRGEVLASSVSRGAQSALFTLPNGAKIYGPIRIRDEYVEFIWEGEKYRCHMDEFVSGTRADLQELSDVVRLELPAARRKVGKGSHSGLPIAAKKSGGLSKAAMQAERRNDTASGIAVCTEQRRLLDMFGEAVQELLLLHEQQFLAIVAGDLESHRFDLLIHMANERKHQAKYAYLQHVETHTCSAK
jgi:hypothetical protein